MLPIYTFINLPNFETHDFPSVGGLFVFGRLVPPVRVEGCALHDLSRVRHYFTANSRDTIGRTL